jgi:hypothetical protein
LIYLVKEGIVLWAWLLICYQLKFNLFLDRGLVSFNYAYELKYRLIKNDFDGIYLSEGDLQFTIHWKLLYNNVEAINHVTGLILIFLYFLDQILCQVAFLDLWYIYLRPLVWLEIHPSAFLEGRPRLLLQTIIIVVLLLL